MSSSKKRSGTLWIIIGILLILTALGLACYNLWDEKRANQVRCEVLEQLEPETVKTEEIIPDYRKFPEMEMPVEEINKNLYIGILEIPSLGLKFPVINEWSYPNLKISPCRYEGSVYQNNLIISAHNYQCHFGNIKTLLSGDEVKFTDLDGNIFEYIVAEMQIIDPADIEGMKSGLWDLTLFTCTYGGQDRVTIRCELIE